MIRAIFFDIDGTLLSFQTHQVPESTQRALWLLREQGVKLFVATGRPPKTAGYLREVFDFDFDGYVTMNGQYCLVGDQVIHEQYIPSESIASLLPYLEKKQIACDFIELDRLYINLHNEFTDQFAALIGSNVDVIGPVVDVRCALKNKVYQLSPFISEAEEPEFFRHLPGCKAARWTPLFTDVIPEDGGKPVGMDHMIRHFGIAPEEVMAFGDGGNDLDMLVHAKIGVAMGNAVDAVKAAADYVTTDVDHDGIWNALVHFGLVSD
ncbi:MAG: Cof-type HAD-IIB family hydrolase [Butyricicoccus pullicaecorum]|nr:Cof-type HAD-IIB family hydrolase [Butyricicoccus pullicaecorum]